MVLRRLGRLAGATCLTVATLLTGSVLPTSERADARPGADGRSPGRVVAPGVISGPEEEYRITFTPQGRTAYFARAAEDFQVSREATIMETRLVRGSWTTPEVASFSGRYPDLDPYLTPDGSELYFSSIRPVDGVHRDDADVWVVRRRTDGTWTEPRHTGAVNRSGSNGAGEPVDELYPTVLADGTMYVGSNRDGGAGGWDLYRAGRRAGGGFGPAENLGAPVNTAAWEFNPAPVGDGRLLVYARAETAGPPSTEVTYALARHGRWSAPRPACVNTDAAEYHPSFAPDARTFYFVRRDPSAPAPNGDLYRLPTRRALFGC